jgi:hypothetical protein
MTARLKNSPVSTLVNETLLGRRPPLKLRDGELVTSVGKAARLRGRFGEVLWDDLIVTNQRVFWQETGLFRVYRTLDAPSSQIVGIDIRSNLGRMIRGEGFRLRFRNGRRSGLLLWGGTREELEEWARQLEDLTSVSSKNADSAAQFPAAELDWWAFGAQAAIAFGLVAALYEIGRAIGL